jgi:hypothetical protein
LTALLLVQRIRRSTPAGAQQARAWLDDYVRVADQRALAALLSRLADVGRLRAMTSAIFGATPDFACVAPKTALRLLVSNAGS